MPNKTLTTITEAEAELAEARAALRETEVRMCRAAARLAVLQLLAERGQAAHDRSGKVGHEDN